MESNGELVHRAALFPVDKLWDKSWRIFPGEATIRKRMNTLNPELTFYSSWFCPFAQRTWIALEESGVKYKWKEVRTCGYGERGSARDSKQQHEAENSICKS